MFWGEFVFCLAWFVDAIIGFADLCAWHGPSQGPSCPSKPPQVSRVCCLAEAQTLCWHLAGCFCGLVNGTWDKKTKRNEVDLLHGLVFVSLFCPDHTLVWKAVGLERDKRGCGSLPECRQFKQFCSL